MFSDEHLYAVALRRCALIGDILFHRLVQAVGSAKDVWSFPKKDLAHILGIGSRTVHEIGSRNHIEFAEQELRFCEKNNIKILLRHQRELPLLLAHCDDAPAILYMKGAVPEHLKPVSIVGTRNITAYGKKFVEEFFRELPPKKVVSVSGLALGADTEVHIQSLQHHIPTIAVLAHGFHTLYPSKNRKLSEKILEEKGALLTEFNSSQKPDRENFIQRNRIIAGLSEATVVVETAFGGGSVSTVGFANGYNREVFALPGKISDKYSQGCNQLIYQNKSAAISTLSGLIADLGLSGTSAEMEELFPFSESVVQLSDFQEKILECIRQTENACVDDIAQKLALPAYKILPEILELELAGKVKSTSGRQISAL